jgi:mRNA-degrading endonuclease toxin of MazEF toxin-antitoxin module
MRLERIVFEIPVVPFPFVDMSRSKPRPALVLSLAEFNRRKRAYPACDDHDRRTHSLAERSHHPGSGTDRPSNSLRRPLEIVTLDNRVLRCRIGRLGDQDADECRALIGQILDWQRSA